MGSAQTKGSAARIFRNVMLAIFVLLIVLYVREMTKSDDSLAEAELDEAPTYTSETTDAASTEIKTRPADKERKTDKQEAKAKESQPGTASYDVDPNAGRISSPAYDAAPQTAPVPMMQAIPPMPHYGYYGQAPAAETEQYMSPQPYLAPPYYPVQPYQAPMPPAGSETRPPMDAPHFGYAPHTAPHQPWPSHGYAPTYPMPHGPVHGPYYGPMYGPMYGPGFGPYGPAPGPWYPASPYYGR